MKFGNLAQLLILWSRCCSWGNRCFLIGHSSVV